MPDEIRKPDIDETPRAAELPRAYCARMAREKSEAIALAPGEILLTADTSVAAGRLILGKPRDADEARSFLDLLSGRRHRVHTALALRTNDRFWIRNVESRVRLKRLSPQEIEGYIATDDWQGKAGGYAIQGPAAAFVAWMQGSFTGIVGLPLHETAQLLDAAGYSIWRSA